MKWVFLTTSLIMVISYHSFIHSFIIEQSNGRGSSHGVVTYHHASYTHQLCVRFPLQFDRCPHRCWPLLPYQCCTSTVDGECGHGAVLSVCRLVIFMVEKVCTVFSFYFLFKKILIFPLRFVCFCLISFSLF